MILSISRGIFIAFSALLMCSSWSLSHGFSGCLEGKEGALDVCSADQGLLVFMVLHSRRLPVEISENEEPNHVPSPWCDRNLIYGEVFLKLNSKRSVMHWKARHAKSILRMRYGEWILS